MDQQTKVGPTPFERILRDIYDNPEARLGSWEEFRRYCEGLANLYGLTDSLTPGMVVYRHDDPNCPGRIRVKLAAKDGAVVVHYFFKEAPAAKMEVVIPRERYEEGMERKINAEAMIQGIVRMLLQQGATRTAPKKEDEPKILLPSSGQIP